MRGARLADGALRVLALAVLEQDTESWGPENGIHPEHVPAVVGLLQDMAVDPAYAVGPDKPLRQVIVNTHSPEVVAHVPDDALVLTSSLSAGRAGALFPRNVRALAGRDMACPGSRRFGSEPGWSRAPAVLPRSAGSRRVMDRLDLHVSPPMVYDRHRERFDPRLHAHRLADVMRDYAPLRRLSAFRVFERDLGAVLRQNGWLRGTTWRCPRTARLRVTIRYSGLALAPSSSSPRA